jgi:hypothetical protein
MADKIEVPKGPALDDLRRQRAEREKMKKEAAAPTTKTEMGKMFKGGGKISAEEPEEDGGSISGGLPPFASRESTDAVTGRMLVKRSKPKSVGLSGGLPPKFKKGGTIRGGGCEQRGKTKGKFV